MNQRLERIISKYKQRAYADVLALTDHIGNDQSVDVTERALLNYYRCGAAYQTHDWLLSAAACDDAFSLVPLIGDPQVRSQIRTAKACLLTDFDAPETAITILKQTVTEDGPEGVALAMAHWHLGRALFKAGQHQEGFAEFDIARGFFHELRCSDEFCATVELAGCFVEIGEYDKAQSVLVAVCDLRRDARAEWQGRFDRLLGRILLIQGDVDAASCWAMSAYAESLEAKNNTDAEASATLLRDVAVALGTDYAALERAAIGHGQKACAGAHYNL